MQNLLEVMVLPYNSFSITTSAIGTALCLFQGAFGVYSKFVALFSTISSTSSGDNSSGISRGWVSTDIASGLFRHCDPEALAVLSKYADGIVAERSFEE